ncbi:MULTISPECIES: vitamin K epoxide reductase family protein [Brachybacterium]|uniref:Vitamin K epoxide reductase family protein n=1 Tax=Brachybacterium kimchii TaxID=2942909 RepID=A0ABY4N9Y5_9MICO|nr:MULTISPECIES: vitamin K epoxide reductase family protein [Brachybacterium]MCG7308019.1 vitamin K epoxide reductase family protein [Brachybacterium sp. ACRRE]UQN30611.1 vitamin K epoxide reductase family protein [Brachybacterium kimchii]
MPEDTSTVAAPSRGPGALFTGTGAIGLVMAVVLLVEKIALIEDPAYVPSCSLDPVLSCGSVMETPQASAFAIPNPILGIAGFSAVLTLGLAILAGARTAHWMSVLIQIGVTFAVLFVHWLIGQSLYEIGALCPYCMIVWAVTIPLFWFTTLHHLRRWTRDSGPATHRAVTLLHEFRLPMVVAWYLVILTLIAVRFWDYWSALL